MDTIKRIMQVALTVEDLEDAVAFYRDRLGLTLLFRTPDMAFFDCGGTRILLGTENTSDQRAFLYFDVEDISDAAKRLAERGVKFDREPHKIAELGDRDVWLAVFKDPSGTIHHLMSEVKK